MAAPRFPPTVLAAAGLTLGLLAAPRGAATLLLAPLLAIGLLHRDARPVTTAAWAGILLGLATLAPRDGPALGVDEGVYRVEARVTDAPPPGPDGPRAHVEILAVGTTRLPSRQRLTARLHLPPAAARPLAPGDRIQVIGHLVRLARLRNPGAPRGPPGWLLKVRDAEALRVTRAADGPAALVAGLRRDLARRLDARLAAPDAALARALLLGDRTALDRGERHRFRATGQGHLLAVSGLHVGLVLAGALLLLAPLHLGRVGGALAMTGLVLLYVPLAGAPPSAVRAGGAALLYALGRLVLRDTRASTALAAVVLAVLLTDPAAIRSLALVLSVTAVTGILALSPVLTRWFVGTVPAVPGVLPPPRALLRRSLAVALAAWLATTPLLVAGFGRLALVAAPLSVLTVPLTALLLATGAATALPGGWAAPLFAGVADLLRAVLDAVLACGFGAVPVTAPGTAWYGGWILGLLLLARGWRRAAWLLAVLVVLLLVPRAPAFPPWPRLVLLEVGHGQAAVLFVPDGRVALLDAGRTGDPDVGHRVLVPALHALGVARLDLVAITHADADHVGGLADVLAEIPARRVVTSPRAVASLRRDLDARIEPAARGAVLLGGAWGRLRVLAPPDRDAPLGGANDDSLVLRLEPRGGKRLLLPGDLEMAGAERLLALEPDLGAALLVLPHHGRPGPARERLIRATRAETLLASCGRSILPDLPAGTRATGREGALTIDFAPDGARVRAEGRRPAAAYDPPATVTPPLPPSAHAWIGVLLLLAFAAVAVRPLRWLAPTASLAALALGLVAFLAFGAPGLLALLLPFTVATLLGRLPGGSRSPARTWRQVVANGLAPFLGATVALLGAPTFGFGLLLGGLAFLGSDTAATEVGVRWGGTPRAASTLRPLPRGTSGGVTALGTLAAVLGAALAPAGLALLHPISTRAFGLVVLAGFAGQVADSILGATVQWEEDAQRPHGFRLVDNDVVNLLGSVLAALFAAALLRLA